MRIILYLLIILISGCMSDISNVYPHYKLIDTVWEFKEDAYVVEYNDEHGMFYIVSCVKDNRSLFPRGLWQYDESNVGKKGDGKKSSLVFEKEMRFV